MPTKIEIKKNGLEVFAKTYEAESERRPVGESPDNTTWGITRFPLYLDPEKRATAVILRTTITQKKNDGMHTGPYEECASLYRDTRNCETLAETERATKGKPTSAYQELELFGDRYQISLTTTCEYDYPPKFHELFK